ncbi:DUF2971 domain-containing protein [Oceanospirillum sanctuarii]|uniref:DUF2971 domain-containing protein n=1 Tax=Oceanospirillum sanctuarii TaxID=1434821 RepID=UPI000A3C6A5B|nr:DUF2971 domain-containing protein [Oceanospirillum sanctuarii]
MTKKLYKYMGPDILQLSFNREGYVGFKCSLPEDYNDPYELFLSIDRNLSPQLLAFYQESIGEMPQCPTTCFSQSPVVVPMWAHYAHTSRGFVIEIDEEQLEKSFDDISIANVTYTDTPNKEITPSLQRAFATCKPRHTFFLHKMIMASAYFSKQTCWSYEQERRVIVPNEFVEDVKGNMIFFVPLECVTSIISGAKAAPDYIDQAKELAAKIGCRFFQSFIGKSFPSKYMRDEAGSVFIFDGEDISVSKKICRKCKEPMAESIEDEACCSWCSINESHRQYAARKNPYRMLHEAGILENHVQGMEDIYRRKF